jgi:hypothetical protein
MSNIKYRHNNNIICCGTLRIARADFDTDPCEEIKKEHFDNLCNSGNRIAELEQQLADQQEAAGSLADDYVKTVEEIKANFEKQLANSVPFEVYSRDCRHRGLCPVRICRHEKSKTGSCTTKENCLVFNK